ncbi:SDR family NAD(P)-dependent oxidoreductase [Bifidobacterium sp.]|jgi:NAD(P)-dependent dehydrogenase (short-subunit alcohol dehydrogenase family)|uniref:SDR family NAD(P)-dependent oxidoreductase n=1 Tax=Bifidobacterium sp. TaxID=41200 RepID=UPI0025BDDC4D|nr:SDR family oxidoreductase [Bifidobacterium sp.]MCH4159863.1 SDR family oxidoreductase [Bifidobacterium sp.]MCH4175055.1 SDR family oxidoreductase [Bifidobacterium sp.]MCI1636386.1 SDR family oxidoreductase [Bifidobacterium sp.]
MSTGTRFNNQTIIVTGAGSGIGKATVTRLLQEGCTVIATDISAQRLTDFKAEQGNAPLETVAGDICDESVIQRIMEAAGPHIDGLVNNAGITDGFLPNAEVDNATWDRVIAVNLTAVMKLTRAVLPLMIDAGKGSIVNISSEAATRLAAGAAYTASKYAVIGLTKNNAAFYTRKGIRTNAVLPGGVATNIEAPFKSEYAMEVLGKAFSMAPAPASSEQLAAAITWLLSDDSANISGTVLNSDGGWSTL